MATVFLARDVKHNRDVAIKVLRQELSASIGTDRFLQEIEIAAGLQHPHILPVYDSGEVEGLLYYVMPFVEGESLRERLQRDTSPPHEALRIAREVASALDYAHREAVVHRDIKPANILLSQGHAVVADFGIARAASAGGGKALTQVGMAVGTPWYMSPEQATAGPNVDGRSDIYALGCVVYEMLEGRTPFDGDTAQAVIAATISAPPPEMTNLAGKLPDTVPAAILRALAKNPADRQSTAQEFATELDVGTGDFSAPRRSQPLLVAGAIAVLLAGTVVFALTRGSGSAVASGADVIAVLPFDVSGVDAALGEGMVSLLSTNLNAAGAVRTVNARTVLQRWRSRGGENGLDLPGSLNVGRDVEAGSVLLGSVVAAGSGVRLTAEMHGVGGEELARVQVDGAADDVLLLVDSLSLGILRAIWRSNEPMPSFDVAAVTSGNLEAVRAYMRGTLHLRRGEWDSAVVDFEEAVDLDSTFAMANLALAESYGWTGRHGAEVQNDASAAAFRFKSRLPAREQLLVTAYHLNRQADPATLDSIRQYTRLYPGDPRGWSALGDFQYHGEELFRLSPAEQIAPFDEAIRLDSSLVAALVHPMEIMLLEGDREGYERYAAVVAEAGRTDPRYPRLARVLWGEPDEQRAAIDSLSGTGNDIVHALAAAIYNKPDILPYALDRFSSLDTTNWGSHFNARYMATMVAIAGGRLDVASENIAWMRASDRPGIANAGQAVRVMAVLGGVTDPSDAADVVEHFRALAGDTTAHYLDALLALAAGDNRALANGVITSAACEVGSRSSRAIRPGGCRRSRRPSIRYRRPALVRTSWPISCAWSTHGFWPTNPRPGTKGCGSSDTDSEFAAPLSCTPPPSSPWRKPWRKPAIRRGPLWPTPTSSISGKTPTRPFNRGWTSRARPWRD
jgi:serine/threonine-protein kinase